MSEQSAWARGYPVHEVYPTSWHPFQSPAHLRVVCALMGVACDLQPGLPMNIAEIGCGTGYTAQILAAGNPLAQVIGLDYNPAHIAHARSTASAAGLDNLRFIEADLAEISDAELDELPELDLVTVHGMWSWVADPVREGVLRLLARRLKPGGLALVSYNAMPGAAGSIGLARLVRSAFSSASSGVEGLGLASKQVQRLLAAQPRHLPDSAWRRIFSGEQSGARPGYLLHEFSTEYWRPAFHADVAAALAGARCTYVGSATISENFAGMSLTPEQQELWANAANSAERELIFDFMVPRAFRRDLFVRGLRRVAREPVVEALSFNSASLRPGLLSVEAQAGTAELSAATSDAIRGALALRPHTVGELQLLPGCGSMTSDELTAVLMGSGFAVPLWQSQEAAGADSQAQAKAVSTARQFNAIAAAQLAPWGVGEGQFGLATPHLAGALAVGALELAVSQVVAKALHIQPEPPGVEEVIRGLLPPGTAPTPETLQGLQEAIAGLLRDRLPIWRALAIV